MKSTVTAFFALLIAFAAFSAGPALSACQSYTFDYGDMNLYLTSQGRGEPFTARHSIEVSSLEINQKLGGWGGYVHVVLYINSQNRASWDINADNSTSRNYSRSRDVSISIKAGDELSYFIFGDGGNASGYITGQGAFTLCGNEIKDPRSFTAAFYFKALMRNPDASGMNTYGQALEDKSKTGSEVASLFIQGAEFRNKNAPNYQYVTVLFQTLFGRNPNSGDQTYWIDQLESGLNRDEMFSQFLAFKDFSDYCLAYGVEP